MSKGLEKYEGIAGCRILIASTGSVATIKMPQIVTTLAAEHHLDVRVVVTKSAQHFYSRDEIPKEVELYTDTDEWLMWKGRGDPVLHIELSKWADILLIAPLDANTLAKLSQGICDNLVTCVARAWDFSKPVLFCPSMNTKMWHHPVTAGQVSTLLSWGYREIPCISKKLMCGDTGLGAMAEVSTITQCVLETITLSSPNN